MRGREDDGDDDTLEEVGKKAGMNDEPWIWEFAVSTALSMEIKRGRDGIERWTDGEGGEGIWRIGAGHTSGPT